MNLVCQEQRKRTLSNPGDWQKDATLALYHGLGKILHNKRNGTLGPKSSVKKKNLEHKSEVQGIKYCLGNKVSLQTR